MSKRSQIRNIILVLSLALLSAFLLAAHMIYYYGPSGSYLAGNIVLSPSILSKINENSDKMSKKIKFTYSGTELSYFDKQTGKKINLPISQKQYEDFYSLIEKEKSILNPTKEIIDLFSFSTPLTLLTTVQSEDHSKKGLEIFQAVEIIDKDYFRVRLRDEKSSEWAYFYLGGIYTKLLTIFDLK